MNAEPKVLVVGTTSDYIDWIRRADEGRALFLTDPDIRMTASEPDPKPEEEVLCLLDDQEQAFKKLNDHLKLWNISVNGVACFDCESLELAAFLAKEMSLPYPTVESIRHCRDKHMMKSLWRRERVNCPRARVVQSADEVLSFYQEIEGPCVLKPISGSGSELVFRCASRKDLDKGVRLIQKCLAARKSHRLHQYATDWFLVEEWIQGDEFSCDFRTRKDSVEIVRLTKKVKDPRRPFGTISAYQLCNPENAGFDRNSLEQVLCRGAQALNISEAVCMVDFIVCDGVITLLEMTPRPGGDCIPFLLKRSLSMDILSYALDCAQQKKTSLPQGVNGQYAALRLHANIPGKITRIDDTLLRQDSRVLEIHTIRRPGHRISMPPHDYDSWYMGHVIFKPLPEVGLYVQTLELSGKFLVEIENDGEYLQ